MSNSNGLEIERKFLLLRPPDSNELGAHGAHPVELAQYYLTGSSGSPMRRLRILRTGADTRYLYTEKRALSGITRAEHESEPTASEAIGLLAQADPHFAPIKKVRWTWPEDGQTWELDIFESPADLVMLEVELATADEVVMPPAWLGPTREVSEDPAYQNASLARALALEPETD